MPQGGISHLLLNTIHPQFDAPIYTQQGCRQGLHAVRLQCTVFDRHHRPGEIAIEVYQISLLIDLRSNHLLFWFCIVKYFFAIVKKCWYFVISKLLRQAGNIKDIPMLGRQVSAEYFWMGSSIDINQSSFSFNAMLTKNWTTGYVRIPRN
jgi:hypothetical protein